MTSQQTPAMSLPPAKKSDSSAIYYQAAFSELRLLTPPKRISSIPEVRVMRVAKKPNLVNVRPLNLRNRSASEEGKQGASNAKGEHRFVCKPRAELTQRGNGIAEPKPIKTPPTLAHLDTARANLARNVSRLPLVEPSTASTTYTTFSPLNLNLNVDFPLPPPRESLPALPSLKDGRASPVAPATSSTSKTSVSPISVPMEDVGQSFLSLTPSVMSVEMKARRKETYDGMFSSFEDDESIPLVLVSGNEIVQPRDTLMSTISRNSHNNDFTQCMSDALSASSRKVKRESLPLSLPNPHQQTPPPPGEIRISLHPTTTTPSTSSTASSLIINLEQSILLGNDNALKPGHSPPHTPYYSPSPTNRLFQSNPTAQRFDSANIPRITLTTSGTTSSKAAVSGSGHVQGGPSDRKAADRRSHDEFDDVPLNDQAQPPRKSHVTRPIIAAKASFTLGTVDPLADVFQDKRPMSPLRAGAKAMKILGGDERIKGVAGGTKGGKERGFRPIQGSVINEIDTFVGFPGYTLSSKKGKTAPKVQSCSGLPPVVDELGRVWDDIEEQQEFAWLLEGGASRGEKTIGVLPMAKSLRGGPSRCGSPDTQSERSCDASEGRRSGDFSGDDVHIVGEEGASASEGDETYAGMDFLSVIGLGKKGASSKSSNRLRPRRTPSELAFLSTDPYAESRPPRENRQRPRPPPLALSLSNGRTKDLAAARRAALPIIEVVGSASKPNFPVPRLNLVPHTPFTRPRAAPKPPQLQPRAASDSNIPHPVNRPKLDRIATDLPVDVAGPGDVASPAVLVDDPFAKGKSFFVEDDSPTEGKFTVGSIGKKMNFRIMSGSMGRTARHRI